MSSDVTPVRLLISPVSGQATVLAERVAKELPTHEGLQRATRVVEGAAQKAERTAELGVDDLPERVSKLETRGIKDGE